MFFFSSTYARTTRAKSAIPLPRHVRNEKPSTHVTSKQRDRQEEPLRPVSAPPQREASWFQFSTLYEPRAVPFIQDDEMRNSKKREQ